MTKTLSVLNSCFILVIAAGLSQAQESPPALPAAPETPAKVTPADGHVIHVTAPHLIDGKVRGPFHHYCKIVSPEAFIECLLYETDDNDAKQVAWDRVAAAEVGQSQYVGVGGGMRCPSTITSVGHVCSGS